LFCSPIISTHLLILVKSSTLFKLQKPNTLEVGLVGGNVGWEGDSSGSGVEDVSSLAGRREDVVVRVVFL